MAIQNLTAERIGTFAWLLTWESTLTDATYYVWRDGVKIGETLQEQFTVSAGTGEFPVFEIFDSASDVPAMGFPGWVQLAWYAVSGADSYRVEQYISGVWTAQRTLDAVPETQPYFTWKSGPLADSATAQFRVIPIGSNGNLGTATTFGTLIVRVPDVPSVSYTYNGAGTRTVTIAAA